MRTYIFLAVIFSFALTTGAMAQTRKHQKTNKQQTITKKRTAKAEAQTENTPANTTTLTSTSSGQAYSSRRFSIADPTINALNERASGSNVPVSSSGIVGMPKGTYGFANGKLLLRNTTAPSSGTMYGSGAVGTGTTITGVGTAENVIGVNGKAPYAGTWLWGTRQPARQAAPPVTSTSAATGTNQ